MGWYKLSSGGFRKSLFQLNATRREEKEPSVFFLTLFDIFSSSSRSTYDIIYVLLYPRGKRKSRQSFSAPPAAVEFGVILYSSSPQSSYSF